MRGGIVISVAALALATAPAFAGEPRSPEVVPQKARALAERGRAFHDAGDYGNAIVAFKEAYVMAPSPGLLFNLAQAYRLAGNCDDASLMYRRYLNTGPTPEARSVAEGHLAGTERCAQMRGLDIPKDEAPIATTGALQPPAPGGGTMFVQPQTARSRRADLQQSIGIGVTLAGGIALSAAAYYAYDAGNASSSVEAAYANGAKWKDVEAIDQRGERSARFARILGVGGGVAVVGGVTLYLLGKRAERMAPIAVVPTKNGAEVSWAWQF